MEFIMRLSSSVFLQAWTLVVTVIRLQERQKSRFLHSILEYRTPNGSKTQCLSWSVVEAAKASYLSCRSTIVMFVSFLSFLAQRQAEVISPVVDFA